jgi:hypothetical protein
VGNLQKIDFEFGRPQINIVYHVAALLGREIDNTHIIVQRLRITLWYYLSLSLLASGTLPGIVLR